LDLEIWWANMPWFKLFNFIFIEKTSLKNGKQKDGKQLRVSTLMENKEMENKNGKFTTIPFYKRSSKPRTSR